MVSCASVSAQETYTRFLIPLYIRPVSGAFGSVWTAETWVMNTGAEPFRVVPELSPCRVLCTGIGQTLYPSPPAQLDPEYSGGTGLLLHVDSGAASSIEINTRVRDTTRGPRSTF